MIGTMAKEIKIVFKINGKDVSGNSVLVNKGDVITHGYVSKDLIDKGLLTKAMHEAADEEDYDRAIDLRNLLKEIS